MSMTGQIQDTDNKASNAAYLLTQMGKRKSPPTVEESDGAKKPSEKKQKTESNSESKAATEESTATPKSADTRRSSRPHSFRIPDLIGANLMDDQPKKPKRHGKKTTPKLKSEQKIDERLIDEQFKEKLGKVVKKLNVIISNHELLKQFGKSKTPPKFDLGVSIEQFAQIIQSKKQQQEQVIAGRREKLVFSGKSVDAASENKDESAKVEIKLDAPCNFSGLLKNSRIIRMLKDGLKPLGQEEAPYSLVKDISLLTAEDVQQILTDQQGEMQRLRAEYVSAMRKLVLAPIPTVPQQGSSQSSHSMELGVDAMPALTTQSSPVITIGALTLRPM